MGKAGLSGKSPEFPTPPDDIPEALRESPVSADQPHQRRFPKVWIWVGLGAIAFCLSILLAWWMQQPSFVGQSTPTEPLEPGLEAVVETPVPEADPAEEALLGHFPYEEAPAETLQPISADGGILLRQAAADRFDEMVAAAQAEGIELVPISGFRSLEDQEFLFFEVKAQRGQQATQRAEVSAPPGYSEHHTGYAVDIADGTRRDLDLQVSFEDSPAFQWLEQNSAHFSFELSFPPGNPQNVSYEPWHWRYVGDRHSLETFYRPQQLNRVTGE